MMRHFQVEETSFGALEGSYPHSPADDRQSLEDYLEDKLSQGLEFVSMWGASSSDFFVVFRVVAK